MKSSLGGALVLVSCALALSAVGAGEEKEKKKFDAESVFKKLDADGDGKLSKAEFLKMADRAPEEKQAKFRMFLSKIYERVANGNDGLTLDQFREAGMMMREAFMKKKREAEDNK